MLVVTNRLVIETTKPFEFVDITEQVVDFVSVSAISNGCAVIFSKHTTGAIKVNENEPLLIEDMEVFLQKLAPKENYYRHNGCFPFGRSCPNDGFPYVDVVVPPRV